MHAFDRERRRFIGKSWKATPLPCNINSSHVLTLNALDRTTCLQSPNRAYHLYGLQLAHFNPGDIFTLFLLVCVSGTSRDQEEGRTRKKIYLCGSKQEVGTQSKMTTKKFCCLSYFRMSFCRLIVFLSCRGSDDLSCAVFLS